jgi:hypothetical protein
MKNPALVALTSIILLSCSSAETMVVTEAPQTSYTVDDYYILMSDAYHLRPGMTYEEAKAILKQDPYEIHQNIEDDCIILGYNLKRNARIHKDTQKPIPLVFYKSTDTYNLTYQNADTFYLIIDSSNKRLRTFFTSPNADDIERYSMLLRRAKSVCLDPDTAKKYMSLWKANTQEKNEESELIIDSRRPEKRLFAK